VVNRAITGHDQQCVCNACLEPAGTVHDALIAARAIRSDSIVRLDGHQRCLLNTFTKRWNSTRAARGLAPKTATEALTEGLEALIAMIGQA